MKKALSLTIGLIFLLQGCTDGFNFRSDDGVLSSIGTTFQHPFCNTLFRQYKKNKGITILDNEYNTGTGIRALQDRTVDFAASDAILSEQEIKEFKSEILSIPVCLGAIVITYNLPEVDDLKLSSALLAGIFLKKIEKWNDPAIKAINPELDLPDLKITVVSSSDESGSNYIFSEYLSKTNQEWAQTMGKGKSINWESDIAVNKNMLVATAVKQITGSITYLGMEHAAMLGLSKAILQNASGEYVSATKESIRVAAEIDYSNDMRIMITNSANKGAYPLACYSFLLVYKNQAYAHRSQTKKNILKDFLLFAVRPEQQKLANSMTYVPLPDQVVEIAKKQIESIVWNKDER